MPWLDRQLRLRHLLKWERLPRFSRTWLCPNCQSFQSLCYPCLAAWQYPPWLSECSWNHGSSGCQKFWPTRPRFTLASKKVFVYAKTLLNSLVSQFFGQLKVTVCQNSPAACPSESPSLLCFFCMRNQHARCTCSPLWLMSFMSPQHYPPYQREATQFSSHCRFLGFSLFGPNWFHLVGRTIWARSRRRGAHTLSLHCTQPRISAESYSWWLHRSRTAWH